jgi:hypothetical protein
MSNMYYKDKDIDDFQVNDPPFKEHGITAGLSNGAYWGNWNAFNYNRLRFMEMAGKVWPYKEGTEEPVHLNKIQGIVDAAAASGTVAKLEAGVYVEEHQVVFPDTVVLEGSDEGETIVRGSGELLDPKKEHFNIDKTVFKLGNQCVVHNIVFDGQNGQVYGGIGFYEKQHIIIQHCKFYNLNAYYVLFSKSQHININHCIMTNNGMGFDDYLIKMGASDHILIDNVKTIFAHDSHGGMSLGFTDFGSPYKIYDLVVQNCDLDGASTFADWDTANPSPAFAIEFAFYTFNNCKIINNIIRRSASLVKLNFYVPDDVSWIIQNNQFLGTEGEEVMAIELGLPRAVITNNYFLNPQVVVAVFGGDGNFATGDIDGVVFDNNVIESLGNRQLWLNSFFYTEDAIKNLVFTNNTIDFQAGREAAIFRTKEPGVNNRVSANIIIADTTGQRYIYGDDTGFDIQGDLAYPISEYESLHEGYGATPGGYVPPVEPPIEPPIEPPVEPPVEDAQLADMHRIIDTYWPDCYLKMMYKQLREFETCKLGD